MPERPDLEYQVPLLSREIAGLRLTAMELLLPTVLRVAVLGDARQLLADATVLGVRRRAHFFLFDLAGTAVDLAIHPMLVGRFTLAQTGSKRTKDIAAVWTLSDGRELRYRDEQEMGKVYVYARGALDTVPGLAAVGVDVLDPGFTLAKFTAIAKKRRDQVKVFLMDKTALDSFGNAYADEVCFAAGLHPKRRVSELSATEIAALHGAIISVLQNANAVIGARKPALDDKVRDFLAVRNRKGQPCPRCGAPVRVAGVHGHDAFFCAICQPDRPGRSLIDWTRVSA